MAAVRGSLPEIRHARTDPVPVTGRTVSDATWDRTTMAARVRLRKGRCMVASSVMLRRSAPSIQVRPTPKRQKREFTPLLVTLSSPHKFKTAPFVKGDCRYVLLVDIDGQRAEPLSGMFHEPAAYTAAVSMRVDKKTPDLVVEQRNETQRSLIPCKPMVCEMKIYVADFFLLG